MRDTPRSVVILAVEYPFSEDNYDKVYDLFDTGHYSLKNSRRPNAKPIEVFVAPTVLELQLMTSVKCISTFSRANETEIEEIVEIDMSPAIKMTPLDEVELTIDDDENGANSTPSAPPDRYTWTPWGVHDPAPPPSIADHEFPAPSAQIDIGEEGGARRRETGPGGSPVGDEVRAKLRRGGCGARGGIGTVAIAGILCLWLGGMWARHPGGRLHVVGSTCRCKAPGSGVRVHVPYLDGVLVPYLPGPVEYNQLSSLIHFDISGRGEDGVLAHSGGNNHCAVVVGNDAGHERLLADGQVQAENSAKWGIWTLSGDDWHRNSPASGSEGGAGIAGGDRCEAGEGDILLSA